MRVIGNDNVVTFGTVKLQKSERQIAFRHISACWPKAGAQSVMHSEHEATRSASLFGTHICPRGPLATWTAPGQVCYYTLNSEECPNAFRWHQISK